MLLLELLGVVVFAVSGGLAGVRKDFDLLAVLMLAAAAALGGGVLRDVLIGAVPPAGISDGRLVAAACLGGALAFFFHPRVERTERPVLVLDAVGLGLFAVSGARKALELGAPALTAVVVGVLTGVGGGVVRDLLAGELPRLFADREWYATPALLGVSAYVVAAALDVAGTAVLWSCVLLIVVLRLLALRRGWQVPAPRRPAG